ncbi:MAG TPA: hypothetical protein VH558_13165 [Pseudolabrys sp.]|jgi:hypothetical protein
MLPILRILPVGGVLLAIFILVLALIPPDGSRAPLNTMIGPARGALIGSEYHPETRHFLIMAALKRADELSRLRDLPDTPTRTELPPTEPVAEEPKVAGLPTDRSESDPDELAPAATETPDVSIPVEIGEVSAVELPAASPETTSAPAKTEPIKPQRRRAHRPHRSKAVAKPAPRPFNLFEILFGGQPYQYQSQQSYAAQQPPGTQPAYRSKPASGTSQPNPQQPQNPHQQPTRPVGDPYLLRPNFY